VGVDAGLVHIALPCYVIPAESISQRRHAAMRLQLCQTTPQSVRPFPLLWPPILEAMSPGLSQRFLALERPGHTWTHRQDRQLRLELAATGWYRPVGCPGVGCRQKRPCVNSGPLAIVRLGQRVPSPFSQTSWHSNLGSHL